MSDEREDSQGASASVDLVSIRARAALERFTVQDRARMVHAFQAAPSELQRELIQRALAAGQPPPRIVAFAAAIRALADEDVLKVCTPPEKHGTHVTLFSRLKLMADPIAAYESWGRSLPTLVSVPVTHTGFAPSSRDLGASRGEPTSPRAGPVEGPFAEDLMNQGTQALGVVYREEAVDRGGLTLAQALLKAAEALADGLPVPVVLGAKAGKYTRHALLLQVQPSGKSRAFQLHDPIASETVWVHEKDFLACSELPLSTPSLKRITAVALPART